MKKLLSIMLAVLMAATAFFAVTASAAEENRSIKFIKDLVASRTLSAEVDTSNIAGGIIKDVKANVKFGDSMKIAGTAKVVGIKVKIFASGKDIDAYFSLFKIDVDKLADINLDLSSIGESINPVFDKADEILKYLEYKPELSSDSEDVLGVNEEEVKNIIIEKAKESGLELTEEDIEGKSISELAELAGITDETQLKYISNLEKSGAHFYYTSGKLTGIKIIMANEATGNLETLVDTSNIGGFKILSLSTNVSDSSFDKPKFAIDITGLVKSLMGFIMSRVG